MSLRLTACRGFLAALLALTLSVSAASAATTPASFSPGQKAAINAMIRDYILDHPEILPQAMELLQQRETTRKIAANAQEIYSDPDSVVAGNPKGDVTIVEFFDYTCPYCKLMNPMLNRLIKSDGHIRFIYKEWPVRGPVALYAARAALAARNQGKYLAFHDALYAAPGELSDARVLAIAKEQGLNIEKLKADMAAPGIDAALGRTHALGQALDLQGTPAFLVGNDLIPGAVNYDDLVAAVHEARAAQSKAGRGN